MGVPNGSSSYFPLSIMLSSEIPQLAKKLPWSGKGGVKDYGMSIVTMLVLLMVTIHCTVEMFGGVERVWGLYIHFGLSWSGVKDGKIWQLISYGFLHGGWFHLIANMLILWLLGGRVMRILGCREWVKIVFWGLLAGGALHTATSFFLIRNGFQELRLVGVSGACYALLLTLTTLSPESKMWPIPVSGKNLGMGLIFCELLLWLMQPELCVPVLSGLGQSMVDYGVADIFKLSHACHFGGAIAGLLIGRSVLTSVPSLEHLQRMRAKREAMIEADDGC